MKKLSIIMPFLNEQHEPIDTIESIYSTTSSRDFEILAIDDNSTDNQDPDRFLRFNEVIYIKNNERQGVDGCRNIGINRASSPNILIIDAHMRFKNDNWLNKIVNALDENPQTIFCSICLGVNVDTFDPNTSHDPSLHRGGGVDIKLFNIPKNLHNEREIIQLKWKRPNDTVEIYDIPCVMGANYFAKKDWLLYLRAFDGLRFWGSSEEYISLKSWLAGGNVKLLTSVSIGHIFRGASKFKSPYSTDSNYVLYNKLLLAYTLFDENLSYELISFVLEDNKYNRAYDLLNENINELQILKNYYKSIFIRDDQYLIDNNIIMYNKESVLNILMIKNINEIKEHNKNIQDKYKKMLNDLPEKLDDRLSAIQKDLIRRIKKYDDIIIKLDDDIKNMN